MGKSLYDEKAALRRRLLARRRAVPESVKRVWDEALWRQAAALPALRRAPLVFTYVGCGFEVATLPLIRALLSEGRPVAVPLCAAEGVMEARLLSSESQLHAGAFGLPEPDAACPPVAPETVGAVIVPGLAFDREGYRLGRGGGYYDRFLARARCPSVGLCYRAFFLDRLPRGAFDVPVSAVVSEDGVLFG